MNQAVSNLKVAHNAIIESHMMQMHQANKRRRPEGAISKGDKVYLSTENLSLPKNRTRKLMPKYIGPYKVVDAHPAESRYTLDLPPELKARRIHPMFHVNRLQPFLRNDDKVFPRQEVCTYYDFGDTKDDEWLVDGIIAHRWEGNTISFLVQWNLGDTTWESYPTCKELEALDRYLELLGIEDWKTLPRRNSTVDDGDMSHPRQSTSKGSSTSSAPTGARRSSRLRN